jgi:hypothetical protein
LPSALSAAGLYCKNVNLQSCDEATEPLVFFSLPGPSRQRAPPFPFLFPAYHFNLKIEQKAARTKRMRVEGAATQSF